MRSRRRRQIFEYYILNRHQLHRPGRLAGGVDYSYGYPVALHPRRDDEAAGAIFDSHVRDAGVCEACGGFEEVGHWEVMVVCYADCLVQLAPRALKAFIQKSSIPGPGRLG